MADQTNKKSNFISASVQSGIAILENIDELRALLREGTVLDYANVLTDEDFTGANEHLTKAQFIAMFGVITAITNLLEANSNAHYRTLYALKP